MEFYDRTYNLREMFDREADLSDLIAANPDVVGEWIGEDGLELEGREQLFGDVKADILFTTPDGRLVEVEVQLGDADDLHLGEIVRHLSQREADIFVWVAQSFNRAMNRVFRQWNRPGGRDYYTVETYGVEGTRLLGWDVIESPYTLDREVDGAASE